MPKARRRKDSTFETAVTKSVFLYGNPNKSKLASLMRIQASFLVLVNKYILLLNDYTDITLQLVKNDKKDAAMRALEKAIRPAGESSAMSQNAFDAAVTHLSNRFDNIRLDLLSEGVDLFARSRVLFAMSIMQRTKTQMIEMMHSIKGAFYQECADTLEKMDDAMFSFLQAEFRIKYDAKSAEYRVPQLKTVSVPLDSRLMRLESSKSVKTPFVISITDPKTRGQRITVPINTSKHSLNKIKCSDIAGTVAMQIRNGKLRITWSYTRNLKKPVSNNLIGVDTGISDALHTSDDKAIGSMKEIIDFYHKTVEPAFAELSDLRNKIRSISHFLRTHKSLPTDVRRSLIRKMDRLNRMMQTMEAPFRKKRHYYEMLDAVISRSVKSYIHSLNYGTTTVLEKLDMKEFHKSRTQNGMFSVFARGKLQHKLMQELNWHGFDFIEIVPDYTSQVCPVCDNLDEKNRNGKDFTCTCCGYHADADYVGAQNIKARANDQEILDACEKYKYNHKNMQSAIKIIYHDRHAKFQTAESA